MPASSLWFRPVIALTLLSLANITQARPLDYADTFALEYAANPTFSPDGKQVFFERRAMDIMLDRTHTSLWQITLADGSMQPVIATEQSIRSVRLSPDGERVAYLTSEDGRTRLNVRYLSTGRDALLAEFEHSPSHLTWAPDGKSLAFIMFTPKATKPLFKHMPEPPKGAKWAESATYIDSVSYRDDGSGYRESGYDQLYVLPAEGGTARQLTYAEYPVSGSISFSRNSDAIYFSANQDADHERQPIVSDIYRLTISDKSLTKLSKLTGPEYAPQVSPDGKKLAFLHVSDRKLSYQNAVLVVQDLASGSQRVLTLSLDRTVRAFEWRSNSSALVFSYLDQGNTRLGEVTLGGNISQLSPTIGGQSLGRPYTSGEFALASNGAIAFTQASSQQPADLAVLTTEGKTQSLTALNSDAFADITLAEVQPLAVTSSIDERSIDAWIALPPNFDASKRYPLILEIHGGPHAAYGPHFSMEVQLMAAKGYVVVWSNPRGSSSYGEDFGNLIHHNYPSDDYQDLMDVVDAALLKGFVDERNLFITGGSGGGVLTAWSIGKTDRFSAAVVAKPVINWLSFSLTADAAPYFTQYWMPAEPWTIADQLWQRSPLSLVGNVSTPTMLLTGEADYRTPISESEQYYQALKLRGIDAAMVRIPGASHGIAARPSRLIQKVGYILAWFEQYKQE